MEVSTRQPDRRHPTSTTTTKCDSRDVGGRRGAQVHNQLHTSVWAGEFEATVGNVPSGEMHRRGSSDAQPVPTTAPSVVCPRCIAHPRWPSGLARESPRRHSSICTASRRRSQSQAGDASRPSLGRETLRRCHPVPLSEAGIGVECGSTSHRARHGLELAADLPRIEVDGPRSLGDRAALPRIGCGLGGIQVDGPRSLGDRAALPRIGCGLGGDRSSTVHGALPTARLRARIGCGLGGDRESTVHASLGDRAALHLELAADWAGTERRRVGSEPRTDRTALPRIGCGLGGDQSRRSTGPWRSRGTAYAIGCALESRSDHWRPARARSLERSRGTA